MEMNRNRNSQAQIPTMTRLSHVRVLTLGLCFLAVGCGPKLTPEDLGTVVYEVPRFDPIDQKYPLPKLGEPPAEDESSHSHGEHDYDHHGHSHKYDSP